MVPEKSLKPVHFLAASGKIFSGIFLLLIWSCSEPDRNFSISGQLDNAAGSTIHLYEMTTYELIPVDSFEIGRNGEFRFEGEINEARFMSLRQDHLNYLTLIVFPGEKIRLSADFNNLQGTAEVTGSDESELAAELNRKMQSTIMSLDSLGRLYRNSLDEPGIDIDALRFRIRESVDEIAGSQRQYTINFIENNPGSLASLMALYLQTDHSTFVLNREEDFKYYLQVDSILIEKYPYLDYTVTLNENVQEMKRQIELREQRESHLANGTEAPEISLPDIEGDTINLSSLRGNYVLLDFWASWCGPCREENPTKVEAYNRYKDKGFDIFQVSLDRARENWLQGIQDDRLYQWTHVSDLQFWSSVVVPMYNIQGIPANFLLDPEGRIIARNLRGAALGNKLEELLN